MINKLLLLCVFIAFISHGLEAQSPFVKVEGNHFVLNKKPYYYIGANYWYGAIIASSGSYGDRPRLLRELDFMKENGITNLRIQAGAEGPDDEPFRVTPSLQVAPGKYNDEMLDGLDFLLAEMGKRGQYAILFLNNSWDWSGGFAQYLNWNGYGPIPYPMVKPNTWPQFMAFAGQFLNCDTCKNQFFDHVKFLLNRTNRYSGIKYTEDPAIMTWEIGNEPRAFSTENIPALEKYIQETASLIRGIDKNHLITTGTEGQWGCENSLEVFERIHAQPGIDYLTMHIWPKNWSWLDVKNIPGTLQKSISNTNKYMDDHFVIARRLNKPIVFEEFGLPRDFHGYLPTEKTTSRDSYYVNAFEQVLDHCKRNDVLAGCNFWGFGGEGRPENVFWVKGDDYVGDPPNEEQGLNSVFNTDSTVPIIKKYNQKLVEMLKK
ncbi:MAG: cellulase family glycosylhydrolase [Lentimicrobiaceae bacterium]|jgi:mannan endo-1,4-beta-mannosidase